MVSIESWWVEVLEDLLQLQAQVALDFMDFHNMQGKVPQQMTQNDNVKNTTLLLPAFGLKGQNSLNHSKGIFRALKVKDITYSATDKKVSNCEHNVC